MKPVSVAVYICVKQWDKQRKEKMAENREKNGWE